MGARSLHDDDSTLYGSLERHDLFRRTEPRRKACSDDALRPGRDRGVYQSLVGTDVRGYYVHARQRLAVPHIEWRRGHGWTQRRPIKGDAIGVGKTESTESRRLEGLQSVGIGLGDLARGLNL